MSGVEPTAENMFRKFFHNLTQSSENKRRARFLESLESFSESEPIQQTDHLSDLVGVLAMAKQGFDQADALHAFGEKQKVDFDPLGEAICDEARSIMLQLAKLYEELPPIFAKSDPAALEQHFDRQRVCFKKIHTACAALQRCGGKDVDDGTRSLSEDYDPTSPLGKRIEKLLLEVRTFERIQDLGG